MNDAQGTSAAAQLQALREQRAALAAAREARTAEAEAARELEVAQRELRDEIALNDAIEKHGEVGTHLAVLQTSSGLVIIKRSSAMKFRRFQDKGDATTEDVLALVRPCVVWPSPAELDVMLEDLPATLTRIASAVIELAGQRSGELGKKS